jgi:O-antigen ligase
MQVVSLPVVRQDGPLAVFASSAAAVALRPMQLVMATPTLLFLTALAAMVLWNPDIPFHTINRLTFGLLGLGVVGRAMVLKQRVFVMERASWPMIGLTLMALVSMIGRPLDDDTAGVLAAKYLVPFAVFHLAQLVFREERHFRQFEIFALAMLTYLSFTAIAFLVGAHFLVFPSFILDPSLGYHADRARGPFLQAVANGVSLNLLGLLALHAYRRGSARGVKFAVLLGSVPVAVLATMTRAVWLSFAGTVLTLLFLSKNRTLRRASVGLVVVAGVGLTAVLSSSGSSGALRDRLEERQPVVYRQAVYAGGWQMFLDRPLTGWGFHQMPAELPRYVSEYRGTVLYPHNTYLEVLVELGLPGLALYVWLMWEFWRLGRGGIPAHENKGFLDAEFHRLWPILLGIYWVNACVVVMSYHFVNALLFTLAGMLAAQQRRAQASQSC